MAENTLTGFQLIDNEFGGLWNGEVTLIGGRPAMGKTSFALRIAHYAAITEKKKVLFISGQHSRTDLELRLVSMISGIPQLKIRGWDMSDEEWNLFRETAKQIEEMPITFCYADTMFAVKHFCKRCRDEGYDLVIFDYLQLIIRDFSEKEKHTEGENLKSLKKIAEKYNVPVVVLTQLSRKLEMRKDRHPKIKDIRGKGIKKKYYNQAFFLYREAYYDRKAPADAAELIGINPDNGDILSENIKWKSDTCTFN